MEKTINVNNFIERSTVNGQGTRAVLWVQGCNKKCAGCFNPGSWSYAPNQITPVSEIAQKIISIRGIDGATFSGGEPFDQADALAELAGILQGNGLTIIIFTGYTYSEIIRANREDWNKLLAQADMLVSGRYDQTKATQGQNLLGSGNQEIISLTGKIAKETGISGQQFELTLKDEVAYLTGFPDEKTIKWFKEMMQGN